MVRSSSTQPFESKSPSEFRPFKRGGFRQLIWVFLLANLLVTKCVFAQFSQTTDITPPSPIAQNFMRYGEIPVDYSTGIPQIEIPIYTIEGKRLNLPISISYHASGIKVNDVASEVGLGWVLNAGGIVSRTTLDRKDGSGAPRNYGYASQLLSRINTDAHIWDSAYCSLSGIKGLEDYLVGNFLNEDKMSDRFFYRLPNGTSGIFRKGLFSDSTITLPYKPYKIERQGGATLDSLKITDDDGTVYKFKLLNSYSQAEATDWHLTEMMSADRTEKITFHYKTNTGNYSWGSGYQIFSGRPILQTSNCPPSNINPALTPIRTQPTYHAPVLEKIVSSTAIVNFMYASREDFTMLRLARITVSPIGASTEIIKKIDFAPKYFGTNTSDKRLGLDFVTFRGSEDSDPQKYSFTYESQALPPYPFKMGSPMNNEDFWGYYNGSNSFSSIQSDFISNVSDRSAYGGNREANLPLSRACMLKEIKYPTGGKTVFQFERPYSSNLYQYKSSGGYFGPFRVLSITNYTTETEVADVKTFEYINARWKPIAPHMFRYDQSYRDIPNCQSNYSKELVFSNPTLPLEVAPGIQAMYTTVVVYDGTRANNTGKTVYNYNEPYSPSYYDNQPSHPAQWEQDQFYHSFNYDKGNYVPELTRKSSYSRAGAGYVPVKSEIYRYQKLYTADFQTGIKLTRPLLYANPDANFSVPCGGHDLLIQLGPVIAEYIASIVVVDTKAFQEASLLVNSEAYIYDRLDTNKYVFTSTDYTYNQNNLQVSESRTVASKNEELKVVYKYPADFGDAASVALKSRNQIKLLLEEEAYQGTSFLRKTKASYHDWGNNIIAPKDIEVKNGNGPLESRLNYLSYDKKGNPAVIKKTGGPPVSYLWDHVSTMPVAKVDNAIFVSSSPQGWYESLFFVDVMNSNQRYPMYGSYSIPQIVNTTITRQYFKAADHQATFNIYVYDAGHNLTASYSDFMPYSDTYLTVSSQVSLPSGSYTVEVSSTNPNGLSYTQEVGVTMEGSTGNSASVPFCTSFEEDQVGTSYSHFKTGRKSYLGSYSILLPGCDPANNKYILSYWIKRTEAAPWEFVTQNITIPSYGSTISIGSANQYLDEVRVYPQNGLMTTYTYDPLRGMTSETDSRDRTTTYEYDNFQRLKTVRNNEGKILKTYDHHLKP
ncbi:YD repeat-containing protein [Arcticibacter pallidicorallinus]|uniref:YD repeat-containing protein n=1 Tax=Arcticibacter pallidicorallinus TaxID=1259464 RepID=A0A2T0TSB6_9SPHI|nr:hypothetical protein [Arcticibacter pallidicorallinus]PRY48547.1 YD repeat-containing protein [Arcticibacter pallidicorallinus]